MKTTKNNKKKTAGEHFVSCCDLIGSTIFIVTTQPCVFVNKNNFSDIETYFIFLMEEVNNVSKIFDLYWCM